MSRITMGDVAVMSVQYVQAIGFTPGARWALSLAGRYYDTAMRRYRQCGQQRYIGNVLSQLHMQY